VDFSDPAIPPGLDAEKIHAGIAIAMTKMAERGWQADHCMIPPDGYRVAPPRSAAPAGHGGRAADTESLA